jgi:hypothetical protein
VEGHLSPPLHRHQHVDLVVVWAVGEDGLRRGDSLTCNKTVDNGATSAVAVGAGGLLAAAGATDGRVKLWDVSSGRLVVELRTAVAPKDLAPLAFSPNGDYLLYDDGGVLRRYQLHPDALIALAKARLTRGLTSDECHQYLAASQCS